MLRVGHPDLIKAKLDFLILEIYPTCAVFQGCTLLVLYLKKYEIGHIDLIN